MTSRIEYIVGYTIPNDVAAMKAQGRLFLAVSAVLHTMARLLKLKVEEKSTHSTSIACQLASSGSGAAAAFCQYRPVVLHSKRQACLLAHALSEKWGMNELVSTVASPPHSHRRQMPLKLTPSKPLRSSARVTSYPSASNAARVTTSSTATASASAAPSIPDAASVSEAAAIAVDAVILREGDALTRHERETRQKQQENVFTSFNTMASRFSYHAKASTPNTLTKRTGGRRGGGTGALCHRNTRNITRLYCLHFCAC